jgi:hypothetical protein
LLRPPQRVLLPAARRIRLLQPRLQIAALLEQVAVVAAQPLELAGAGGNPLIKVADPALIRSGACLQPADFSVGAGKSGSHGLVFTAELGHPACVLVTLLAKRRVDAVAARQLFPRLGEMPCQFAILPRQGGGARRHVGDTAMITGLFFSQGDQASFGNCQRLP